MEKTSTKYLKQFEGLFKKEVIPSIKKQLDAVNLAKNKQESLTGRFEQNNAELETLKGDLEALRRESVQYVMSEKKNDEYIGRMSKIKGRISLLNDAQAEIKEHLLPDVKKQLEQAYIELKEEADKMVVIVSNQVRDSIFEIAQENVKRFDAFHTALAALSENTLGLPRLEHRLNYENLSLFPRIRGHYPRGKMVG